MARATEHDELPLRERKKAQTRQALVAASKACFAKNGFDATTMAEVARAAGVSEQTVYNYFPTKEALVFDRDDEMRDFIVALADDARGLLPAMRDFTLGLIDRMEAMTEGHEGGMVALVAAHPRLRGEYLLRMERNAEALAAAMAKKSRASLAFEKVRATAAMAVFGMVIDEVGKAVLAGRSRKQTLAVARKTVVLALRTLEAGIG